MSESERKVGYGNPTVGTRFKPGQCGNPKRVRRKKPQTFAELLEQVLSERVCANVLCLAHGKDFD